MYKFITKFTFASIVFCLGYYYFFRVLPEFFIGSVSTSIFWLSLENKRDKSIDDSLEFLFKKNEEREKQLIWIKEITEQRIKEMENCQKDSTIN